MKEDILEQIVDEYLQHLGYFTRHNIKYRPDKEHPEFNSKKDSVESDIDVIGINPNLSGFERVVVVSCKSWQKGFNTKQKILEIENNKIVSGREAWQGFRELTSQKWGLAFLQTVQQVSNEQKFTYMTAVTSLRGEREVWETYEPFSKNLKDNRIKILTLEDMLNSLYPTISTTPASSSIGRTLQLMKASGWIKK